MTKAAPIAIAKDTPPHSYGGWRIPGVHQDWSPVQCSRPEMGVQNTASEVGHMMGPSWMSLIRAENPVQEGDVCA